MALGEAEAEGVEGSRGTRGRERAQHPFSPALLAGELAASYPDPCLYLISLLVRTQYLVLQFTTCSYRHPGICLAHSSSKSAQ